MELLVDVTVGARPSLCTINNFKLQVAVFVCVFLPPGVDAFNRGKLNALLPDLDFGPNMNFLGLKTGDMHVRKKKGNQLPKK